MKPLVVLAALAVGLVFAASASASNGPGTLVCSSLSPYNPTHYALVVGTTVTCTIVGATDVADGSVDVWVKSSASGNTLLSGVASGGVITFTYTAPLTGCDTTVVAYGSLGNNADNDAIDDGDPNNNSGKAAAGFAFVDANGTVVPCGPTAVYVTKFSARYAKNGVNISWKSSSSPGVLGYYVVRDQKYGGGQVNSRLLPAGSSSYKLHDKKKATCYYLYARMADGRRVLLGSATTS